MFLFSHLFHLPKTVSMSVVLQEVWLSLSPPPRVFSGISLRPREALRGNYLGRISCTYSHTEMIFGTIFKYSKTNYMQNKWQHFIKKHKSYAVLTVLACHLQVDERGQALPFKTVSLLLDGSESHDSFCVHSHTHAHISLIFRVVELLITWNLLLSGFQV